jgi:hypothetical protein
MRPREIKMIEEDAWEMRRLVERYGWQEFMRTVSGMMAEQVDKTSGKTSSSLLACHQTFSRLDEFFGDCGQFEYSQFFNTMLDPRPDRFRTNFEREFNSDETL